MFKQAIVAFSAASTAEFLTFWGGEVPDIPGFNQLPELVLNDVTL